MRMRTLMLPAAVAAAGMLLAGCAREPATVAPGDETESAPPATATLDIAARDYAFGTTASEVRAGRTVVRLRNLGNEPHQVMVARLRDGVTAADLADAVAREGDVGVLGRVQTFLGGPNGAEPGERREATLVLEPGRTALLCLIPSPDGTPHAAKGMVAELSVQGPAPQEEPALPADVEISLMEYAFDTPDVLPAGATARVLNVGGEAHELVVFQPLEGRTPEDVLRWIETMQGPPPSRLAGGTGFLSRHQANIVRLPEAPGRYVLACFMPTAKGVPHRDHGMTAVVEVT